MEGQNGYMISGDKLSFFHDKPAAPPLYEAFAQRLPVEIGDELMSWIKEAAEFSAGKR